MSAQWFHAYLTGLLQMWHNSFVEAMRSAPFPVKSSSSGGSQFLLCQLLGSVPFWPIWFTCGTDITHEVTMCSALFPDLKVTITPVIQIFAMSAPSLSTYLTISLNMGHKYNPWGDDVHVLFSGHKDKDQCHTGRRSCLKWWPLVAKGCGNCRTY